MSPDRKINWLPQIAIAKKETDPTIQFYYQQALQSIVDQGHPELAEFIENQPYKVIPLINSWLNGIIYFGKPDIELGNIEHSSSLHEDTIRYPTTYFNYHLPDEPQTSSHRFGILNKPPPVTIYPNGRIHYSWNAGDQINSNGNFDGSLMTYPVLSNETKKPDKFGDFYITDAILVVFEPKLMEQLIEQHKKNASQNNQTGEFPYSPNFLLVREYEPV